MTRNVRISLALVVVLAAALGAFALANDSSEPSASAAQTGTTAAAANGGAGAAAAPLLRPDTHKLSKGNKGTPTLVEFLDFECEGCGALYPYMEQLRTEYTGRVTFAIRYFPLSGHFNGMNAALAVEAAARQGALEPMYKTMFETQRSWGEARESHAETFVGFARRLGLDVPRFKRDVADPATAARIQRDQDDGAALGVESTPTLFLDGQELVPESLEQLRAALDAALEG
jgi:protein-disulfide isomerase